MGPLTSEFTELPPALPVQPEPLVRARPIDIKAAPAGARAKIRRAARAGLVADATYALGYRPNARGTDFSLVHSVLVRLRDPQTHEVLVGAHWTRNVPDILENEPRYGRAEWLRRVISAYPKWSADSVLFRDRIGSFKMTDLDTWLADREAE